MPTESHAITVLCSHGLHRPQENKCQPTKLTTGHTSQASIPNFSNFFRYAALDLELLLVTKKILLF